MIPGKTAAASVRCARTPAPRKAMARTRRGRQGFDRGTRHGVDITESRVSTTTTETIDASGMNPARVAKQLEQIRATAPTTDVGILFSKQHTRICNDGGMSEKDALACTEGGLIKVGKHARSALDLSSHDLKDPSIARESVAWGKPEEAAPGLHPAPVTELDNDCYGDVRHCAPLDDRASRDMEFHATGEQLTVGEMRQLSVAPDPRSPCTTPTAAASTTMTRVTQVATMKPNMTEIPRRLCVLLEQWPCGMAI